jgi:IS30 family transposase
MMISEVKKKYKHFTERERYKLEALIEQKVMISEISKLLKKNRVTIYREFKRGKIKLKNTELIEKEKYRADVAQADYEQKVSRRERSLKIGKDHELEEYIRKKIKDHKYSPDAIMGEIRSKGMKFEGMICTKTLYNYIERGLFNGISSKELWEGGKRKKRRYTKGRISLKNRCGRSIEERSKAINQREEAGHWEGDCVKGPQGKSKESLFTLTEKLIYANGEKNQETENHENSHNQSG